ncbi:DNA polymerase Y family protein [Novosphingobium resinovorum]|nr:DNA polymerase Y family protein [Novosphingobium resinovorum]
MPRALVARDGQALRLAAVDRHAARQGLAAGMTLADARARCPDLATAPHDAIADTRALERLAAAMIAFTPLVALDAPHGIMLDVTGCAHLFGGEAALVRGVLEAAGHVARHGLAANAAAARALARFGGGRGEGDVTALPVTALELAEDALAGLRRAGLETLGDLAARPMAGLAARFGEAAVMRLRAILGEAGSPVVPLRLADPIRLETRFAEPIARTDDALEVVEDLLVQAARMMEQRQLGGRRFGVTLHRSDNARRRLVVETGQAVREAGAVMRLLRERIDTLSDPLDPGFGFDAITLAVLHADHLPSRQILLEDGKEENADDAAALVDQLSVRLGEDSVRRLVPRDRHLPEKAQALVPALRVKAAVWPAPEDVPPRPLLLLDPPQPVEVIAGVPDSPPQRFRWKGRLHDVTLAEGPERIGAEWWLKRGGHMPGAAGETRDYYRIEDGAGRRYWIFRHGLFSEKPDPRWYLHGLFP